MIKLPTCAWTSVAPLASSAAKARASVIGATGFLVRGLVIVLANSVLRYSYGLHQLNLTALLRGRLKLRLPAAPLLAHLPILFIAKIKISDRVKYFEFGHSVAQSYAIRERRGAQREKTTREK